MVLIERWLAAAMRAFVSRARATDESPKAQAEADRLEKEIREVAGAAESVKAAREQAVARRAEFENRRTAILVVGRPHEESEIAEMERLSREIERAIEEERLLGELHVKCDRPSSNAGA